MGILFYLLAQPLNPDNQQPRLYINDDWLTGGKAGKGMNGNSLNEIFGKTTPKRLFTVSNMRRLEQAKCGRESDNY